MEPIKQRIKVLQEWLQEEHPEVQTEQCHLDAETTERAYWHFGYLMALKDVMRFLGRDKQIFH